MGAARLGLYLAVASGCILATERISRFAFGIDRNVMRHLRCNNATASANQKWPCHFPSRFAFPDLQNSDTPISALQDGCGKGAFWHTRERERCACLRLLAPICARMRPNAPECARMRLIALECARPRWWEDGAIRDATTGTKC
jgi:hypothetical protein